MSAVRAERLAREILEAGGYSVPIDVVAIARSLGVSVRHLPLESSVSGMLVVQGKRASIAVNENDQVPRQRFSIAHEIGHYLLHSDDADLFVDGASIYYRGKRSSEGTRFREIDANAFAGELLMPKHVLVKRLDNQPLHVLDEDAITELATSFQVSMHAMTVRLDRLRLLTGLA